MTTKLFQDHIEPLDSYIRPLVKYPTILNHNNFVARATTGQDGYIYFGFTTMYGVGLICNNEKLQEASVLTVKAVIESYVVSHIVLKSTLARHRPARPLGDISQVDSDSRYPRVHSPLDFFNWNTNFWNRGPYGTGFPSYHATMYFAIASVNSRVFNNYWIPHSAMVFGLLYDIRGHNHWVSELVAGAVIGEFIGKVVYENYHKQRSESNTTRKKKKFNTDLSVGQTFGVMGPSLTISW